MRPPYWAGVWPLLTAPLRSMVSKKDVKSAVREYFKGSAIPNEPMDPVDGDQMNGVDPTDTEYHLEAYGKLALPLAKQPLMRTLLMGAEVACVCLVLMIPAALLLWLKEDYQWYSLIRFKPGQPDFTPNSVMEFLRWSVFCSLAYGAYIFSGWAVGMATVFATGSTRIFGIPLTSDIRHHLKLIKRAQGYIAVLLWFGILWVFGNWVLYQSSMFEGEDPMANAPRSWRVASESVLVILAFIWGLLAFEKYLIQVTTYAFHREGLADRIKISNDRHGAVSKLFRIAHGAANAAGRFRTEISDMQMQQVNADQIMNGLSVKDISAAIWKKFKAHDRDFLRPEDFNVYINDQAESRRIFKLLDGQLQGKLTERYLRTTVKEIITERDRVQDALVQNTQVIGRFDNALMSGVALVSVVGALSLYHAKGYSLVVSMFTLFLTVSFLVKDTMSRLSDAFRFIYIQRAFDVGDRVIIDGSSFIITKIRLFTTTMERCVDKVIVYMPNHALSVKTIINTKRLPLTRDTATIKVQGNLSMLTIGKFRSQLDSFTKDTFPEYAGACAVAFENLSAGNPPRVQLTVVLNFQQVTDEKVLARRAIFKNKVLEILDTLQISTAESEF